MDPKRRFLLKSALASGVGGALLGAPALSRAASGLNPASSVATLLLSSDAAVEASFGAGVQAALGNGTSLRKLRADHSNLLDPAVAALNSGRPIRLIGMVDDALGELLIAQARRAGARLHWLGEHAISRGQTRHQVINSQGTQGAALELGEQLQHSPAGFALSARQPFSHKRNLDLAGKRAGRLSTRWASHLGYALAAPGAVVDSATLELRSERLEGHFVSFVIEV
ncbi:hypothetical protein ACQUQP_19410 [Marinobacterium sp. YM272]|uniref:hypothetical protein n=1 Tax=Marinobacterium sp. YM272 TaxID=3421654 RepID=UPI003D7F9241